MSIVHDVRVELLELLDGLDAVGGLRHHLEALASTISRII